MPGPKRGAGPHPTTGNRWVRPGPAAWSPEAETPEAEPTIGGMTCAARVKKPNRMDGVGTTADHVNEKPHASCPADLRSRT